MSHLPNFDLSRNKSLHTLETMAESVDRLLKDRSPETASEFLNYALSTIKSLVSYRVLLMYQEHDFCGVGTRLRSGMPHLYDMSPAQRREEALQHHRRFELLREMHKVRGFRLELCANVWEAVGEYTVQALREAVATEGENG